MKVRQIAFPLTCAIVCLVTLQAAAATEGDFQRTLKINGTVNLDIETGSGNIQVSIGSSDQVQITGHIRARNWFGGSGNEEDAVKRLESNPPIQQSGNDIRLGHIDDPSLRHNISISYEVVVPADTRLRSRTGSGNQNVEGIHGSLDLQTGSGNLGISNIGSTVHAESGSGDIHADHINGNLRAKSGSGSIHATEVAGGMDAESGSGDIKLEQTAAGSVRAETGSGGLELRGVRGSLQASSGSGDIRADGSPTGSWDLHTGSGSVQIHFPAEAAYDLHAHTGSGGISVGPPMTVQGSINKHEVRGKVHGGGVPVELETGSGGIEIN
jgi:DUF4097 and DUF4098 domain-containing protein YvlB